MSKCEKRIVVQAHQCSLSDECSISVSYSWRKSMSKSVKIHTWCKHINVLSERLNVRHQERHFGSQQMHVLQ